jgi:type II secretory pathway component PulC
VNARAFIISAGLFLAAPAVAAESEQPKRSSSNAPEFIIEPYLENGEVKGYTVSKFRQGSQISKLGFREGDVIQRVNGEKVDSSEKAVELHSMIKNQTAADVKIDILRQKKTKTIVLNTQKAD